LNVLVGAEAVTFRNLVHSDMPRALELCRASHWNQVERDWRHLLRFSPNGCRGALVEGRVAGTVSTVRYGTGMAWIGMLLVDPAHRGRGIGTALLDEALRLLRDVPTVWLDATPAGYPLYRNRGFEEDSRLVRMECLAPLTPPLDRKVILLKTVDALGSRDREVFGANRRFHLEWLLEGLPACARSIEYGYVLARQGERFLHIGPVVAPELFSAERLIVACLRYGAGRPAIVDATLHDPEWRQRLRHLGFTEQRGFVRMRKGPAADKRPHPWEYAIMGPEFG
jgi:GNAT superfamily N-acetyltransferase